MDKIDNKDALPIVVAMAGNPNCGKTSLFNWLTGTTQHVGNYPGVTVEKKEGHYYYHGRKFRVIDLPGIYSINAYSQEERITRQFLIEQRPTVLVDVVDGSNLERNLYLTAQFLEINMNMVLALNMADELRNSGRELDLSLFSQRLKSPVVETIGHKGVGIEQLKKAIDQATSNHTAAPKVIYNPEVEEGIAKIEAVIAGIDICYYRRRYLALKLIESDEEVIALLKQQGAPESLFALTDEISAHIENVFGDLPDIVISDGRYGFAAGIIRECSLKIPPIDRVNLSEKIDAVLTHRFFALPIFLFLMYLLFLLVFIVGEIPMHWLEYAFQSLATCLARILPENSFLGSFLIDGIIGGVGGVVVFLPNIILLFLGIALLEDSGYIARSAFIMDQVMHKIGLHGKSFIPMLIGFGCTVPAIMATRTLENRRDRLTTMLVLPLISCGARLPIYALIIPAFIPQRFQAMSLWSIYVFGIVLAAILAKVLRSTILKGEDAPFVMELPPYRFPTFKGLMHHMWQRSWSYLKKAGTVILLISVIIWLASYYPRKPVFAIDKRLAAGEKISKQVVARQRGNEQLQYSILGRVGKLLEPVVKPMGFDWRLSTALLGAFAAKEVFVAQLGVVFSLGEIRTDSSASLREKLRAEYSALTGVCILIFCLIATPCMATVAVMSRESGSWSWAMLQFWGLTIIAYILATAVYQIGTLLGL